MIRSLVLAAGVASVAALLWRHSKIACCMRVTGWPRWCAAIDVDVGDWNDPGPSMRRLVGLVGL